MKLSISASAIAAVTLLSTLAAASPDHASALRIFRRDDTNGLVRRDGAVMGGLFKRQTGACVTSGYSLCPSGDFCCPTGLTCVEGGWCGDESATTCYAGEDDCGAYCCLEGYRCSNNATGCVALTGSSSSSTGGVDTGRKNTSKGGQKLTGSAAPGRVKAAGGLGAVVAVAVAVAM